ncbi:phage integrase SAM-like domain-containing protein [Hymenobacter amundsenii]|uniref:phage integrase SAM-like domain-containing protein n=1 Tax=Hymenobacter amundsenii TaxID=2006685 RepID=UPI0013FDA12C|nr:phage integrase SAM-like domain-containing protein [Hymenobacter amundsenii]
MKITRQLREDLLNQNGYAPIQVTICWQGHRKRVSSGEVCRPAHWNPESREVNFVRGNFSADINKRLADINYAAVSALNLASTERRLLPAEELLAAVNGIVRPAAAVAAPVAEQPAAAGTPTRMIGTPEARGWYDEWVEEQAAKMSKKTKRLTSKNTIRAYRSTQHRLQAYEEYRQAPLQFADMTLTSFYQPFCAYVLDHLGKELNTFGKYMSHLNTFLRWCDIEQDLPVHRHYRKFTAPEEYIGVDALSDAELLAIAALRFRDPELQPLLLEGYAAQCQAQADFFRKRGKQQYTTSSPSVESPGFALFVQRIELARDKFLQCCYLGVSISDADTMPRTTARNQVIEWRRGKSGNACYIPYFDDDIFKPVALAAKYAGQTPLFVPCCYDVNEMLKVIARLIDLTRLNLSTKIGRKTFVTIKLFQGVPQRMVMMATGHSTEASFNRYVGVDLLKLLEQFKRHSPAQKAA